MSIHCVRKKRLCNLFLVDMFVALCCCGPLPNTFVHLVLVVWVVFPFGCRVGRRPHSAVPWRCHTRPFLVHELVDLQERIFMCTYIFIKPYLFTLNSSNILEFLKKNSRSLSLLKNVAHERRPAFYE